MTNEDAIGLLNYIQVDEHGQLYMPTWYSGIDADIVIAIDMAIEAIEKVNTIQGIINSPNSLIQEDVLKYQMICEVLK